MEFLVSALVVAGLIVLVIVGLLAVNAVQQRPGRFRPDVRLDDRPSGPSPHDDGNNCPEERA